MCNVPDALAVFVHNKILALMQRFRELNDWAGEELVRLDVLPSSFARLGLSTEPPGPRRCCGEGGAAVGGPPSPLARSLAHRDCSLRPTIFTTP